jgi:hypothetical protein
MVFLRLLPIDSVMPHATTRRLLLGAYIIGFFLGYISWIIGAVLAAWGMQSLIRVVRHRRGWLQFLEVSYRRKLTSTRGGVVAKSKTIDPWTQDVSYSVTIEYTMPSSSKQQIIISKTLEGPVAQAVYEDYQEGKSIKLTVVQGQPKSAIPQYLLRDKVQQSRVWAHYIDVALAFVFLHIYVFGALAYAWFAATEPQMFWFLVAFALLSPFLMAPYIIVEQSVRHRQRLQDLTTDPSKFVTELEFLRNAWQNLGPNWRRKVWAVLFPLGVLGMIFTTNLGFLPACVGIWTFMHLQGSIPTRREFLESFRKQAKRVQGTIISRRRGQTATDLVTIRYTAPTGERVQKEVMSRALRHEMEDTLVDVMVLPDHPKFGYPKDQLEQDINKSYDTLQLQVVCALSLVGWLVYIWTLFQDQDFWDWQEVVIWLLFVGVGPLVVLPQAYVLRRVRHRNLMMQVFGNGTIVQDSIAEAS